MVPEIPTAWEAISWNATLTAIVSTQGGLVIMPMQTVDLTLVAKQASTRREVEIFAGLDFASIWLKMGVYEFTGRRRVLA